MTNTSVDNIPADCDIAVVQTTLQERARKSAPQAQLVIGIAGIGDEHLELLSRICEALEDEAVLEKMKKTDDVSWILEKLS
ncbi:MAG: hypothetical protein Q4G47_04425 [Lachnospiraceae bacterium]|nr:hypothetical protein [Lachnospiraceae bacterium]